MTAPVEGGSGNPRRCATLSRVLGGGSLEGVVMNTRTVSTAAVLTAAVLVSGAGAASAASRPAHDAHTHNPGMSACTS
jgi:hypothetical protein